MNCRYCGAPLNPEVKFCSTCGRAQQTESSESAPGGVGPTPPPIPPLSGEASAQTGRWISAGWDLLKADWLPFILMAVVFLVINSAIPLVLQGPLIAGFHVACIRKIMTGKTDVGDLFKAFNRFGPCFLAFLVTAVFIFLGTLLCLIPGLVLAAMYQFAHLFIVDKKLDFWPAMQASHDLVKRDYVGFTLFWVVLILLNIAGALLCLVGLLVTTPLYYAAITAAYRDLVGFENREYL
jgi:uncharacterized membrane protein